MKNILSLEGKVIVLTGAGQGIGKAIMELAVDLGARVVAVDLNSDALMAATEHLTDEVVLPLIGNVADPEFTDLAVSRAAKHFGALHGLVNNAGITRTAMIENMTLQQWQQVIDVHLTGSFLWTQAVGRHMLQRSKAGEKVLGSIVNISSDAGRRGTIGQINYAAAKAGMLGMTMSVAKEWAKYQIRANTICFGVVETPMTEVIRGEKFRDKILTQIPLGYWAQPEEVVKAVCFLLSDASSYITGQHLGVNGGFHMAS
jgi:3-oxoacyl-[acyl-carrier protein] reductase